MNTQKLKEEHNYFSSRLSICNQKRIQDIITPKANTINGAVGIVLVDEAGTIHYDVAGFAENNNPASNQTIFGLASITKTVVAVICMQCCERGELSLDEDINCYLNTKSQVRNPFFPDSPVTVRHLLKHCSGLNDDESALKPGPWRTEKEDCLIPLSQYVEKRILEKHVWNPYKPPGKAPYHYSNAGFALLGLIIETVSNSGPGGVEFLAKERIFKPLNMNKTGFFKNTLEENSNTILQFAIPQSKSEQTYHYYGVCEYTAASLKSSIEDISKYIQIFLNPEIAKKVLSLTSLKEIMPSEFPLKSGLAWWGSDSQYGCNYGKTWTHGGYMDGIRTHAYIWPKENVAAVILSNGEEDYDDVSDIIEGCLADHLKIPLAQLKTKF